MLGNIDLIGVALAKASVSLQRDECPTRNQSPKLSLPFLNVSALSKQKMVTAVVFRGVGLKDLRARGNLFLKALFTQRCQVKAGSD